MTFDYESWLKQAQDQLEALYQKRLEIDREIADLQRGIEAFTPLVKKYPPWDSVASKGITQAIKQVFTDHPNKCFSPTAIRDELIARKAKLEQQNPLATIHQIISRLEDRGFIKPLNSDGRRLHYYLPPEPSKVPPGAVRYGSGLKQDQSLTSKITESILKSAETEVKRKK